MVKRGEVALRLVRDDVPVRGRVLDSQGRPVAGVVVRIRAIWEVNDGVDLDAMLASGAVDEEHVSDGRRYGDSLGPAAPTWQADPAPLWPGGRNAWTTGADGRFEVRGIGRDRIARLEFHGGGVADGTLDVMARPAKAPPKARPLPSLRGAGDRGPRSRVPWPLPAGDAARRRDLRLHRRPDQADRRRRPPEGVRQAGRRRRRPGRRPGDAYRRHRPDRRRGPLPPRWGAEGGILPAQAQPEAGDRPVPPPLGDHQ